MIYIGGIKQDMFIWSLADFGLGIMTVINILVIIPIAKPTFDMKSFTFFVFGFDFDFVRAGDFAVEILDAETTFKIATGFAFEFGDFRVD